MRFSLLPYEAIPGKRERCALRERGLSDSSLSLSLSQHCALQLRRRRSKQYVDAALYLQDEVAAGRVNHVALTNFGVEPMEKVTFFHLSPSSQPVSRPAQRDDGCFGSCSAQMWDAGVKIAANQIQYSLLDRRPELYMNEFCRLHGIGLLPYGVMAGGFLSDRYLNLDAKDVTMDTSRCAGGLPLLTAESV